MMADSNDRTRDRPKRRYKTYLDPNYDERRVNRRTHASWLERSMEITITAALEKNIAQPIDQDGLVFSADDASPNIPDPHASGSDTSNMEAVMDDEVRTRSEDAQEIDTEDDENNDRPTDDEFRTSSEDEQDIDTEEDDNNERPTDEEFSTSSEDEQDIDPERDENNEGPNDDDTVMFGASALSIADVMHMITAYSVRFCLSHEARRGLIEMVKCLAGPMYENWEMSKYKFKQRYDPPAEVTNYTFFCTDCKIPLMEPVTKKNFRNETVSCPECQLEHHLTMQSSNRFVYVDMEYQFRELLSNRKVRQSLADNIRMRDEALDEDEPSAIRDVYDGELYRTAMKECSQMDSILLTYNFNTDGMPIFNSSKKSSWPLLLILNELPPHLRFKYVLLGAIWVGDKEPTPQMMNTFMQQFVLQSNKLTTRGITIKTNATDETTYKIMPLCCIVDSVARPIVQNRLQFNGYHGCSWCYGRGKYVRGAVRYLFDEVDAELRTHDSHKKDVEVAENNRKPVNGVKGASILLQLLLFNVVWGFPLEYMHAILLGVIKLLWEIRTTYGSPVYLTPDQRIEINARLMRMTPIHEIQRLPRTLSDKSKWKASEWLSWLLFYSLPCLHGIIADEALDHLSLLVESTFILLQNEISVPELNKCEVNLVNFVGKFEILYGEEYLTFNVHSLLHLVRSVKMSGPLWASSAFSFESTNYQLKKEVNGPKAVDDQISNRYLQKNLLHWKLGENSQNSESVIKYRKFLFERRSCVNHAKTADNAVLLGQGRLRDSGGIVYYDRCIVNGAPFHSATYKPSKRKNDSTVRLVTDEIVQINGFLILDNRCYVDVQDITVDGAFQVSHISRVRNIAGLVRRISVTEFKEKVLILKVNEISYICKTPRIVLD